MSQPALGAEDAVSDLLVIPRNAGTGRVTIPGSGPGGFRVPDFDPVLTIARRGTIVEVKDVARLSSTPQLRDLHDLAVREGVKLEIFTNAPLPSRGDLFKWFKAGDLILSPLP